MSYGLVGGARSEGNGGGEGRDAGGCLLIAAPMWLEALLIGSATRTVHVRRTGVGCERSFAAARELREHPAAAVLAMGFCGGLEESSKPGDVIVSDRLLRNEVDRDERPAKATACAGADALAATLADHGLRVRRGMVVSVTQPVRGRWRAELRDRGAIAVDMESAWLAFGLDGWPFGAVRVVVDTPARELTHPLATLTGGIRAAVVLRRVASAVDALVRERGVHTVFGIDS
jgi:4-hydroxy-3-methylbut-2-en-1-yl diphosphate reductase